jgi:hypothetical protein
LFAARHSDVRDGELARRYVRQELERLTQGVRVQPVPRRQQEDLRIEALERELELLLAPDLDDEVEPQLHCLCVLASEPLFVLARILDRYQPRIGTRKRGLGR